MKSPRRHLLLGGCLALSPLAGAGTYLENTHTPLEPKKPPSVYKMWFDAGRLRTEGDGHALFMKDKSIYLLNSQDKTYWVLDTATLQRLGGGLAEARKKMEAQLSGLPPEQRAMVEKMMGKAIPPAPQKRDMRATDRTETVAGRTCKVWEVSASGQKEQELCVVPPAALPGGDEMLRTLREIGGFLQDFTQDLGGWRGKDFTPWGDLAKIDGIPILNREFDDGKTISETRLSAVRTEVVPASAFEVPADYKRKEMPGL